MMQKFTTCQRTQLSAYARHNTANIFIASDSYCLGMVLMHMQLQQWLYNTRLDVFQLDAHFYENRCSFGMWSCMYDLHRLTAASVSISGSKKSGLRMAYFCHMVEACVTGTLN